MNIFILLFSILKILFAKIVIIAVITFIVCLTVIFTIKTFKKR